MKRFQLMINNQWLDAESGKTFLSYNPCNGEPIAELAYASKTTSFWRQKRLVTHLKVVTGRIWMWMFVLHISTELPTSWSAGLKNRTGGKRWIRENRSMNAGLLTSLYPFVHSAFMPIR